MRKLLFITAILFAQVTFAQQTTVLNIAKLDSLITIANVKDKAMISVAILQNGKPVYSKAVGYSEIKPSHKTPATTDTRYRIGSISKVFTGTMIFQLIEEGKLSLSTPLSKFFPQVTNAAKINIGNLLNHSSGLYNFTNDSTYSDKLDKKVTHEQHLASFNAKPVFEPGTKHEYSNTNFVLLGYIIEKLDKKTYAAALKARITDKTGLKNTYYGGKINPLNKEANSYQWSGSWQPSTETDMSIPGGAGAVVSTPSDLTKFLDALFNGKLVGPKSLTEMKTIQGGFGMAMFMLPFYEKQSFGHNGGIDGFQSQAMYFPEDKTAVALIGNGFNTSLNALTVGVLSILFNRPYAVPTFESVTLKSEDLDKYLGVYATPQLPIKITITKKDNILIAQATGQQALPLEAGKDNEFKVDALNINLTFDPDKGIMTLKQNGATFAMTREK